MHRTELSPFAKLSSGDTIEFCPATQSWWPKGHSPEGQIATVAATLDAAAVYERAIGMRTRDIRFTPLTDDKDTELEGQADQQ